MNRDIVDSQRIIVVSGLPRSGTSLMMKMLEAGGLPLFVDGKRAADQFNPNGYYEYEAVKQLKDGATSWLAEACGHVVKVVSPLLPYLPDRYSYQVIFMNRALQEVIRSQAVMLNGGRQNSSAPEDAALEEAYRQHLVLISEWLKRQNNMQVHYVDYHQLLFNPKPVINELLNFLAQPMNGQAMEQVIDLRLYRNRSQSVSPMIEEN